MSVVARRQTVLNWRNLYYLEKNPDLCVSGINHSSNASIAVVYSGTMSAAMEAAMKLLLLVFHY